MAVSLPTSADVRKARTEASDTVKERFEHVKTPLLAWVGAGDLAYSKVTEIVDKARARAGERRAEAARRRKKFSDQVKDLPNELRDTFSSDELRKRYDDASADVRKRYDELADRGETAVEKFKARPQVKKVRDRVSEVTDEIEKAVDKAVDRVHDAGEEVFGRVSTETRSAGEKAARGSKRLADQASGEVAEASDEITDAIDEGGAEVAGTARGVSRKAATKTAPKKPAAKTNNGAAAQ